jgi:hypothetical protein
VRLTDAQIPDHLQACGFYWMITRLERADDVVSIWFGQKCGGTSKQYVASFEDAAWHLGPPGTGKNGRGWVPGIGSGFVGKPLGCPCIR